MIYQPGRTNPADYGFRHPPPPKSYTSQERQELGVEEEEEDAKIQVGRVLAELGGNVVRVGRVDMEPPLAAIIESDVQQAKIRDWRLITLIKVVQTGLGRK